MTSYVESISFPISPMGQSSLDGNGANPPMFPEAKPKHPRCKKKIIPARDPKQWGGAKGDETRGGDDDDDDTQMRAHM